MAAAKAQAAAHEALAKNRRDAIALAAGKGAKDTRALLQRAARELQKRIDQKVAAGPGDGSFTVAQMRATLRQIQQVVRELNAGLKATVVDRGEEAAQAAAENTAQHLVDVDRAFRGAGAQPLAIREATMIEAGVYGARSSILMRLASSGEPVAGADATPHKAKMSVLERYGVETIKVFEATLQRGLLQRKSWRDMQDDLTEQSPFLKGKPAFWAERIVRTEVMGAYNRSGWEATREADEQLGDMLKVLVATFDERTGADSYNVHGEQRRPDEAFEYVGDDGSHTFFQHPPNRPNDRETIVPHRVSWPLPKALQPLADNAVLKAYAKQKKKFPGRPEMISAGVRASRVAGQAAKDDDRRRGEEEESKEPRRGSNHDEDDR